MSSNQSIMEQKAPQICAIRITFSELNLLQPEIPINNFRMFLCKYFPLIVKMCIIGFNKSVTALHLDDRLVIYQPHSVKLTKPFLQIRKKLVYRKPISTWLMLNRTEHKMAESVEFRNFHWLLVVEKIRTIVLRNWWSPWFTVEIHSSECRSKWIVISVEVVSMDFLKLSVQFIRLHLLFARSTKQGKILL